MITERIKNINPSITIEMEGLVEEYKIKGENLISLNAGEPDFNTPKNIIEACNKAMIEGKTKYISINGIEPLREAICEKLKKDNNVEYQKENIVVSTGAKQALYNAVMCICNPNDEILIPTPCWVSYVEIVKLANGKPILVKTDEKFHLDIELIKKAITKKTKAIILNTPNNPTGAVYSETELRELAKIAIENDFYIISDEVYEKLVYGGNKHICIASFSEEIKEHSIIINGFSKAYAMTGWRIGYAAAPKDIAKGMSKLQGHVTSNSTTFVQWGALEALKGPQFSIEEMRKKFDERRNYLLERLSNIEGINCKNAEGAFYLMPDVSYYFGKTDGETKINDSIDFCNYMLEKARLVIIPGDAFDAPNNVRIAYSNSLENIKIGIDAMQNALNLLR